MRKQIQSDGNSARVRLTKEDLNLYELKIGDIIDIEICKIKKRGKNGKL